MDTGPIQIFPVAKRRFSHLFARICEEEDSYVVQVRLHNGGTPRSNDAVWGESITDSIETASEMIAGLASDFSISPDRITLEFRMDNVTENTWH
jgi:hypothetical protein